MMVRLLKDWQWYTAGALVDVFEPAAREWIAAGVAEEARHRTENVEQAMVTQERRKPQHQRREH